MQTRLHTQNLWKAVLFALLAVLVLWAGSWLFDTFRQAAAGMLLALAALPAAQLLEKHLPAGAAAALALLALMALAAGSVVLLLPALVEQIRRLISMLPELFGSLEKMTAALQRRLEDSGLGLAGEWQRTVLDKGRETIAEVLPHAAGWFGQAAGNVGKWLLSPALAFYFLRDRRQIGAWLLSLLPLQSRRLAVRIAREVRRETTGYLRGQLLISLIVGVCSGLGLLLCGVPAWAALGMLMGVMEMIPYAGPVIGGMVAVLFALPGGLARTCWTLAVIVAVQQAEGLILSPRLMSGATRLHPLMVILCITAGGAAGGMTGVLAAVPLVLCLRAALRVMALRRFEQGT